MFKVMLVLLLLSSVHSRVPRSFVTLFTDELVNLVTNCDRRLTRPYCIFGCTECSSRSFRDFNAFQFARYSSETFNVSYSISRVMLLN